jgi:hypothetical protein
MEAQSSHYHESPQILQQIEDFHWGASNMHCFTLRDISLRLYQMSDSMALRELLMDMGSE